MTKVIAINDAKWRVRLDKYCCCQNGNIHFFIATTDDNCSATFSGGMEASKEEARQMSLETASVNGIPKENWEIVE